MAGRHQTSVSSRNAAGLVGGLSSTPWKCPELVKLHLSGFETAIIPNSGRSDHGSMTYGPYFLKPLKSQIRAMPKLELVTLNRSTHWTKKDGFLVEYKGA
ncbi:hypothetical protein BG004_007083 [Podila humilis]|nr:hypothetical protein BG004_007083 [Podila humilis]